MGIPSSEELELLIRAGNFASVTKALKELNTKKIPRAELAIYANLANRVNFTRFTLRILSPIVRGEEGLLNPAADVEKSEYADALRRNGLIEEAMQIFSEVDSRKHPIVLLRMAFCNFMQWKYTAAIPLLENYLRAVSHEDYARRIATINLAAALVTEGGNEVALGLLNPLRDETRNANNKLLHTNCLELMTQVYVRQGDWQKVAETLVDASRAATDDNTIYSRYIKKWRAIAHSLKVKQVHSELYGCREDALRNQEWETVRECDLFIGFISQDRRLLENVYYGTPFPSYRKRILELVGDFELAAAGEYLWSLGTEKSPYTGPILDLAKGGLDGGGPSLEAGQLSHRLLILLCRDFYRPVSQGSAFSNLYPGEHFMQQGSTNRVCQVVRGLRSWLKKVAPDVSLETVNGSYRLQGDGAFNIRVPSELLSLSARELEWNTVRLAIKKDIFSKRDVMQAQNCSDSAAKRLLRWAVEVGRVQTVEWGAHTKYQVMGHEASWGMRQEAVGEVLGKRHGNP